MAKMQFKQKEGNLYDKIFKENAEQIFMPLIEDKLGVKIKHFQVLQEKFQTTIEREMDFFYEVETIDHQKFLLHLEFQLQDDKEMVYRSAEYHGIALRRKHLAIKHLVIFLGKGLSRMQTSLPDSQVFKGFDIINIHAFDLDKLLSSQVPEVVLLAILSQFPKEKLEMVLRLILQRLKKICKHPNELSKYQKQLIVLSRIRKFDYSAIKIINDMTLGYDVSSDYLFNKGIAEGIEEGTVLGEEKGKKLKTIQAIINMHKRNFEAALIAELLDEEVVYIKKVEKELALMPKIIKALAVKYARINSIAKRLKVNPLLVRAIKETALAKKKSATTKK
ncbi:MAG: hypothetical protein AB8G86_12320 [Saprospiraceae bacterium]